MPDALPVATLPISRLGTGSTNGSNNGGGWGFIATWAINKLLNFKVNGGYFNT
jgi:hypothetical protein